MVGYLRNLLRELDIGSLLDAAERAAAVLLCLSIHETCHGLAALALGDPTAKEQRRLSLNPLRHIDWLGLAMMFAAGFGWARPVPVDPRYFRHPRRGMALTALAGPCSNLVTAVLALLLARALYPLTSLGQAWEGLFYFLLRDVAILSIGLGIFNLLPLPPLDGSKVVAALLPDGACRVWMRYERYGMVVLLAVALLGWQWNLVPDAVGRVYTFLFLRIFSGVL